MNPCWYGHLIYLRSSLIMLYIFVSENILMAINEKRRLDSQKGMRNVGQKKQEEGHDMTCSCKDLLAIFGSWVD